MTPNDMEYVSKLVLDASGIVLTPDKQYLVESRLNPIARRNGFGGLNSLVEELRRERDLELRNQVVEAMTTNETFFFRDKTPFKLMEEVVYPHLVESRGANARVRIWAAACSTGQEPYSLAMQVREMSAKLKGMRVEILATDLSTAVLERARSGLFTQFEVQRGLPIQMLVKYFKKEEDSWRLSETIRDMVSFKEANLLKDFAHFGRFDVVFCRNVLIYFSPDRKKDILNRLAASSTKDGFLVLGAAETVLGLTAAFTPDREHRGLYRRDPNAPIGQAA